jgi:hypothetical protein
MKFHGKEKKRLASKARKVKMSSLLVGPKSFSFERLVAIFNAISEESGLSTSLCAQVLVIFSPGFFVCVYIVMFKFDYHTFNCQYI